MNVERSRNTDYSQHVGLIHKLARRAYGRLMNAGIESDMDYEDVYQIMCLSYVKAAPAWNPEVGVTFTAYLGRAIWNDFNKTMDKLTTERTGINPRIERENEKRPEGKKTKQIGYRVMRFEDFEIDGNESPIERIEAALLDERCDPALLFERKHDAKVAIASLSSQAKLVVRELIHPSKRVVDVCGSDVTIASIGAAYGLSPRAIQGVRKEFKSAGLI